MTIGPQQKPLRKRNVLVIGGAGYIGSVLVRKLLFKGYKVRVMDKLFYNNGASLATLAGNANFSFSRGDFCNENILQDSLAHVTDVILLAALVGDPICKKYPELARRINEEGAIRLFDLIHGIHINKFVFTSTCSNYGLVSGDGCATEETELNPQSLYAETKVNVERHIIRNTPKVDFCPTILRLSTAFGISARMRFDLTISEFSRTLALGKDLIVYDELTWRPYCHVDDISESIIKVIESPEDKVMGKIFNVGDNENNYTKQMIVEALLKYVGGGNVIYGEAGPDRRNYRVSFDKIFRLLGFKTRFSVEGSIKTLINAVRSGLFDDVEVRKNFYGNYSIKEGSHDT